jgi:hypothetical protein
MDKVNSRQEVIMKYYRMTHMTPSNDYWFLGHPIIGGYAIDPRIFTKGEIFNTKTDVLVTVNHVGSMLDISFADNEMIIFNAKAIDSVRDLLRSDCVEVIPVRIEGRVARYYIINVLSLYDCIDKERSEFSVWRSGDGLPHKVGQYRTIYTLHIDKNKLQGQHILRISDWKVALIVSETFKERITQWV